MREQLRNWGQGWERGVGEGWGWRQRLGNTEHLRNVLESWREQLVQELDRKDEKTSYSSKVARSLGKQAGLGGGEREEEKERKGKLTQTEREAKRPNKLRHTTG